MRVSASVCVCVCVIMKEHVTQCNSEAPWCVVIDFGTEEGDIYRTLIHSMLVLVFSWIFLCFDRENVASDPASA